MNGNEFNDTGAGSLQMQLIDLKKQGTVEQTVFGRTRKKEILFDFLAQVYSYKTIA